jgi:hypothetical protein
MSIILQRKSLGWIPVPISGIQATARKIKVWVTIVNSGSDWGKLDEFPLVDSDAISTNKLPRRGTGGFAFNAATYSVQAYGTEPFRLPVHRLDNGHYLLKMISGANSSVQKVTISR